MPRCSRSIGWLRRRRGVCFDLDSLPPVPVISGGAITHEDLELESRDRTRFAAFVAMPEEPAGTGIVILPDVRGLYRFYEELALRFAERGYAAVAIDYFGRTAGVGKRDDDFPYREHVDQTTPEGIQADVAAAVDFLHTHGCRPIFTVGFCFGGRNSWLSAASGAARPARAGARSSAAARAVRRGARSTRPRRSPGRASRSRTGRRSARGSRST